nr:hypothetical protein [Tanacetum cinerariifolium]
MQTKIELTLKQSQQGVSNDVLVPDFKDDCDDDDFESNNGTQVAQGPGESVGKCSDLKRKSDSKAIPETRFEDEPMDKFNDINSIPHSKP